MKQCLTTHKYLRKRENILSQEQKKLHTARTVERETAEIVENKHKNFFRFLFYKF